MDAQEFYGLMTERVADALRDMPEVDDESVERINMHTVSAMFDGGRIEIAIQHDVASPGDRVRG